MRIVISIGGSLITSNFTPEGVKGYANVLKELKRQGHEIVVVVGGGKTARDYITLASSLTKNKSLWDELGILATKLNALLLICSLGDYAHPRILESPREVVEALTTGKIIICGGNEPGCSTDWDAAIIAEYIRADLLINATTSDGVYDSDPRKNPSAKKFKKLSFKEFFNIVKDLQQEPGKYALFDLHAIKIVERSNIKTIIINGKDPEEILRAVEGKHSGTVIG